MAEYTIPSGNIAVEIRVKRSLFICSLAHCRNRAEAESFIREISAKHHDANHNCWAFAAGEPDDPTCWGMNDDGEPKGCAGKPMFNVLHHSGIGEVCAVVSRYFGGIKLGTGGMARAYSTAVQTALEQVETTLKIDYTSVQLLLPYSHLKTVQHLLDKSGGAIRDVEYGENIRMTADIPQSTVQQFLEQLNNSTHGAVSSSF